ncbi:MAG: hypothetical protein RLZZ574_1057, partial [Cyanobacteriota bacterium]
MTEKFRLAANVLLKRRLNNLVRIDDHIEIDRDFITCAEYQLFIDEMRQEGKNRQPDHWTLERFPPGQAKQPITGVRAKDAEEFCQWLTKKESVASFGYRLPSLIEARESSASRKDIGCWSKDQNTYAISNIADEQWQIWQEQLTQYLVIKDSFDLDLELHRELDLDLYSDVNLDLELHLNLDLELHRDLNRDLNFNLNFNLNRDRDLELYRDLNRDLNFNLYRDLDRNLDRNLVRELVLYRELDLYRDFYFKLNIDLDYDLDLYRHLY